MTRQGNQVLTFTLGEETYGVDILRVQEIRGWSPVTRIPQSQAHMLGVLNLRGSIVPIVDLRMRFSLPRAEYTPLTVIIVLSVESPQGRRDFGLVVDGVSDVIDVPAADVKAGAGSRPAGEYGVHRGVGRGVGTHGHAARYRSAHRRGSRGCDFIARRGQCLRPPSSRRAPSAPSWAMPNSSSSVTWWARTPASCSARTSVSSCRAGSGDACATSVCTPTRSTASTCVARVRRSWSGSSMR